MGKLPKFMICENPIAAKAQGRVFLLHTQEPIILAEVFEFDAEDEDGQMKAKAGLTTGATLDLSHYDGSYHVLAPVWVVPGGLVEMPAQQHADKLAGVMRRMADWYESYIRFIDKELDNEP